MYLHTVIHKIMYRVVNFFFLSLSCSAKKGGKIWKNLLELNKQVNIKPGIHERSANALRCSRVAHFKCGAE